MYSLHTWCYNKLKHLSSQSTSKPTCLACLLSSDEELLSFRCWNGVTGDVLGDSGVICSSELILQLTYCGDKKKPSILNYSTWVTLSGQQRAKHRQLWEVCFMQQILSETKKIIAKAGKSVNLYMYIKIIAILT